jgi:hypothetical protein
MFARACWWSEFASLMPKSLNNAAIAPAVERTLGKGEVACSNHAGSTIFLFVTLLSSDIPQP